MLRKTPNQQGIFLPGIPSLLNCIKQQQVDKEVSNVVYVQIISERADSKDTLVRVIGNLHQTFVLQLRQKWVIVVGDAKTYDLLHSLCIEYGTHLRWLLPFPGDWHVLFNYQKAIMKAYSDAGLVHLAKESGHRAETLTSLIQCSNFRRTHTFLMQSFEAFYRFFISLYMDEQEHVGAEDITSLLQDLVLKFSELTTEETLTDFRERTKNAFSTQTGASLSSFTSFMEDLSAQQSTIRFWYRFTTEDCFAYIALYIAIRYRLWPLRVGSMKLMAPIFQAFDRPTYQRLVPQHLKDLTCMPQSILQHLQAGEFSVSLSASEWHAAALDECHEMRINRDAKLAVIRPNPQRMEHLSNYLSFRAACVNNLRPRLHQSRSMTYYSFVPLVWLLSKVL